MPHDAWTLGLSAALLAGFATASVLALRRLDPPGPALLALSALPVALLLAKADFRIYSFHGLLHTALVYRILDGGLPPSDPLFGGAPLLYAWAHHALLAGVVHALGCTPPSAFALFNVAATAAISGLLFCVGRALGLARGASLLAVVCALWGVSLFARGPLAWIVEGASGVPLETRFVPIYKFTSAQSNQAGLLGAAMALHALVRLAGRGTPSAAALLELGGAVLLVAFLYPLLLPALGAAGAAGLLAGVALGRTSIRTALAAGATAGLALLPALPYLDAIGEGKAAESLPQLALAGGHLLRSALPLAGVVATFALVAWPARGDLIRAVRARPEAWAIVAVLALVGAALSLVLHLPLHSEYKFLALAGLCLGLPSGLALDLRLGRSPAAAAALLALLLLPAAAFFAAELRALRGDPGAVASMGSALEPTEPVERALQAWIRAETPPDAVFVDGRLAVPVFGHRALLAPLDPAGDVAERARALAGFGLLPSVWLVAVQGRPPESVRTRQALVRRVLSEEPEPLPEAALAALRDGAHSHPVYVITRGPRAERKLQGDARFRRVFARGTVLVHELLP